MGRNSLLSFLICIYFGTPVAGQPLTYGTPGSVYRQSFDGLPVSGSFQVPGKGPAWLTDAPLSVSSCTGWQIWIYGGSGTNINLAGNTGSATGNGIYSLGSAGSADRALGSLAAGTGVYAFGMVLTNTSALILNRFTLSFTMEQWRKGGSGNVNTWLFHYKTGQFHSINQTGTTTVAGLSLQSIHSTTGAGMLSGNLPENRRTVSIVVDSVVWKPGEQLLIRWDDADETGQDDICAIDDLTFSAEQVSSFPTVVTQNASSITASSARLHGLANEHFLDTHTWFMMDSASSFRHPWVVATTPDTLYPGAGLTQISADVTLQNGKTYYYYLAASNSQGIMYGDTVSFTTQASAPVISITASADTVTHTAILGAVILHDGGMPVTQRGFIWSLTNPFTDTSLFSIAADTIRSFSAVIAALPRGVTVYIQAFASSIAGSGYSAVISIVIPADTIKPVIKKIGLPPDKTYIAGDTLLFRFCFSEKVTITGNATSSAFSITVGTRVRNATCFAGNGSDSLVYGYIIQPGESDKDGIRINLPFIFSNPPSDSSGNQANTSVMFASQAGIVVDAVIPDVAGVTTPAPANYITGNLLDFLVSFSKKVLLHTTDSSLYLPVFVGDSVRRAFYAGGSGTSSFLFRYKIHEDDIDADGIKLGSLSDGVVIKDPAGNHAAVALKNIGALSKVLVNIPAVSVTGVLLPPNRWYRLGDTLVFTVQTNEPVWVITLAGIPSLKLTIGNSVRYAYYTDGSGSTDLRFSYPIQANDLDTNGIETGSSISLNGATIANAKNHPLPTGMRNLPATVGILVDGIRPTVKQVVTPLAKTYRAGDTLMYRIIFSEPVYCMAAADTPFLQAIVGSTERRAKLVSCEVNALTFYCVILANEIDKNGVFIDTLLYSSDSAAITDLAGNPFVPVLKNISAQSGIRVNAVVPGFASASDTVTVCQNGAISIQDCVQVNNTDPGETISWTFSDAKHGIISEAVLTAMVTGSTIVPRTVMYTPDKGFSGIDSIVCGLIHGSYLAYKTIIIRTAPSISNNLVSGEQAICTATVPQPLTGSVPEGGTGSYQFVWEISTTSSTNAYARAASPSAFFLQPGKLTTDTWVRRKVNSGPCESVSAPVIITVLKRGLWTGMYDNNWHNTNNWCNNTLPDSTTDVQVILPAKHMPEVLQHGNCRSIHMDNNTTLRIAGPFSIYGQIHAGTGMVDATTGALHFAGGSEQVINADVFREERISECTIGNSSGVSVRGNIAISKRLSLVNKGLLRTNGNLLLTEEAIVGICEKGTRIEGAISLKIQLPVKQKSWQLVGNPFDTDAWLLYGSPATVAQLASASITSTEEMQVDAFCYQANTPADSAGFGHGWQPFAGQDNNVIWKTNKGVGISTKGEKNSRGLLPIVFTGNFSAGEKEVIPDTAMHAGYDVIANPFLAPIDLSKVTRGNGIGSCYWVWDLQLGLNGGYRCIPAIKPFVLPVCGAFIVKSLRPATNSLLFTDNCRAEDSKAQADAYTVPYIALTLESEGITWDHLLILGIDSAWAGIDYSDGEKILNTGANLYSLSREKKKLSVDARRFSNNSSIPLGIATEDGGSYAIAVSGVQLPAGSTLMLHDRYLSRWLPLKKDSSYRFTVNHDTASYGDSRFELTSFYTNPDTAASSRLQLDVWPVPATSRITVRFVNREKNNSTIRIYTASGNSIIEQQVGYSDRGEITLPVSNLAAGIYILELRCGSQKITRKFIKK